MINAVEQSESVDTMRNVAVILAGGIGQRMGSDVPKQFLEVDGKPIIVYTLENFERNPSVTDVLIVCNPEWIDHCNDLVERFGLGKVRWVVPGGKTSHDSTRNGVFFLKDVLEPSDFVIIHDAARPVLPQMAIDNMLDLAHEAGNASLAIPCYETVIRTEDKKSGIDEIDRDTIMRVQTPQAYRFSLLTDLYDKAEADGRHDFVYADLVAIHYGVRIYFSKGFINNLKITKPEDLHLFGYLLGLSEEELYQRSRRFFAASFAFFISTASSYIRCIFSTYAAYE